MINIVFDLRKRMIQISLHGFVFLFMPCMLHLRCKALSNPNTYNFSQESYTWPSILPEDNSFPGQFIVKVEVATDFVEIIYKVQLSQHK